MKNYQIFISILTLCLYSNNILASDFDKNNPSFECLSLVNNQYSFEDYKFNQKVKLQYYVFKNANCATSPEKVTEILNILSTTRTFICEHAKNDKDEGFNCYTSVKDYNLPDPGIDAYFDVARKKLNLKKEEEKRDKNKRLADYKSRVDVDTVAKVLNYSDGCEDDGCGVDKFWYKKDKNSCIYEKATSSANKEDFEFKQLNLSRYDPKSITIQNQKERVTVPNFFGKDGSQVVDATYVMYDGKYIFRALDRDSERVKRGWTLIYSRFCKGNSREF